MKSSITPATALSQPLHPPLLATSRRSLQNVLLAFHDIQSTSNTTSYLNLDLTGPEFPDGHKSHTPTEYRNRDRGHTMLCCAADLRRIQHHDRGELNSAFTDICPYSASVSVLLHAPRS